MLTSTLFGQGRVAFTTAFMLFSRREDNAKDLESFASEKGKIPSLNDRNILFRCIFYDFLWELPKNGAKSSAKSGDISTVFWLSGFSTPGLFFNFSKTKQYYANVCALHFQCKKNYKNNFSWSRITSTTNFWIKYTSLSDTSEVRAIKCKSCFVYLKTLFNLCNEWMNKHIKRTQNLVLKGFIQISVGLSLKANTYHKRIVELSSQAKLAIQDVKVTEFELVL